MAAEQTIAAFAASHGIGPETVRFYQREGLLRVPPKGRGAFRVYGDEESRRLAFIRRAQAAGFTLKEIAELIRLDRTADRARVQAMARARLATLDAEIADRNRARRSLKSLLAACESLPGRCACPIVESFVSPRQ